MKDVVVPILVALLGSAFVSWLRDFVKGLRDRIKSGGAAEVEQRRIHDTVAAADQSVLVVARARDELEADNVRLRQERDETERRHLAERREWVTEKAQLKADIDALESRLRQALDDLATVRARHGFAT